MIIQLNPTIPVTTPRGKGLAWFLIDYSEEHNLMWVVALNQSGEVWTFQNPDIRADKNITMGRFLKPRECHDESQKETSQSKKESSSKS